MRCRNKIGASIAIDLDYCPYTCSLNESKLNEYSYLCEVIFTRVHKTRRHSMVICVY